jgi:splicing factor 3B subunit 5
MATQSDRININSQIEHLQAKYVGTGHADFTKFEWAVNMHRDSYASYIGHHNLLAYFALVENESVGRTRCGVWPMCGWQGGCSGVAALRRNCLTLASARCCFAAPRYNFLQKMLLPCGIPPAQKEDEEDEEMADENGAEAASD